MDEDFGNDNYMNVEISDIGVSSLSDGSGPNSGMFWLAGSLILLLTLMGAGFYIVKQSGGGSYYDEEYDYDEGQYPEDYEE